MPKAPDISTILLGVISDMTGGLIYDSVTVMSALVVLSLILMGFEFLKDIFEDKINTFKTNRSLDRAHKYAAMRDSFDDEVSKDYFEARYRNEIRKAAK